LEQNKNAQDIFQEGHSKAGTPRLGEEKGIGNGCRKHEISMKTKREERRKKLKARLVYFVEQYRGVFHPETKVWIRKPKPQFQMKIRETLEKLVDTGYELSCAIEFIEKCQSYDQFYKYVEAENWEAKVAAPDAKASGILTPSLLQDEAGVSGAGSEHSGEAEEIRPA
jgi:hypothetical protein